MEDISNWDAFFWYGQISSEEQAYFDLLELLIQQKRSFFYYRRGSAGVSEYENNPNGFALQILARFEIANAVAYRNSRVVDGSGGTVDRRIAVSQNAIGFDQDGGNLNVQVLYFLYDNYEEPKSNSFPLGQ